MPAARLMWVGLFCCLVALLIQVFPQAAFRLGADAAASWLVFGFGVFLIVMSSLISLYGRNGGSH